MPGFPPWEQHIRMFEGRVAHQNAYQPSSTSIIEATSIHCQETCETTQGLLYFYFDLQDPMKQTVDQLIRSLVYQLLGSSLKLPDPLCRLFAECENGDRQPTPDAMLALLHDVLHTSGEAYIVIDALDECTEREKLFKVFGDFMSWTPKLHFLVTSRKEPDIVELIQPLFTSQVSLEPQTICADIYTYISGTLKSDDKLRRWGSNTHTQIEEALMKGANGM